MKKFLIFSSEGELMDVTIDTSAENALNLWNNPMGWTVKSVELTTTEKNRLANEVSEHFGSKVLV